MLSQSDPKTGFFWILNFLDRNLYKNKTILLGSKFQASSQFSNTLLLLMSTTQPHRSKHRIFYLGRSDILGCVSYCSEYFIYNNDIVYVFKIYICINSCVFLRICRIDRVKIKLSNFFLEKKHKNCPLSY